MRTKKRGITQADAMNVSQLVLGLELSDDFNTAFARFMMAQAGRGPDRGGWFFMMLNPTRYTAVVRWLQNNSSRPMRAVELWGKCLELADRNDGYVTLDRQALATEMHIHPTVLSRLLGELSKTRALIRERAADGRYTYRLNRLVATNISDEKLRAQLQLKEPEIVGVTGLWPHVPVAVDNDDYKDILVSARA